MNDDLKKQNENNIIDGEKNQNHILLFSNDSLLDFKIFEVLERNYCITTFSKKNVLNNYYNFDKYSESDLNALVQINKPDKIIYHEKDNLSSNENLILNNIIRICDKQNIKLIYINEYNWIEYKENTAVVKEKNNNFVENVSKLTHLYVLNVPIVYGQSKNTDSFHTFIISKLLNHENVFLDNKNIVFPVLADEIAVRLKLILDEYGIDTVFSNKGLTLYDWALLIASLYKLDDSLIRRINEDQIEKGNKKYIEGNIMVSDINEGMKIVRNQEYCAFNLVYKCQPSEDIYNINVAYFRFEAGRKLANKINDNIKKKIDCVMPVPSTGIYYALGLAQELGVNYVQGLVKLDSNARYFEISDYEVRNKMIKSKIHPIKEMIENKSIAIVDEAIFTGVTIKIVCDILRKCKAKEIHLCIPTPKSKQRCKNYEQPDRMLLLEKINEEYLVEYFGVDSLIFQDVETFKTLFDSNTLCMNCFEI